MTCVSMHQPGYFPWIGLLEKINLSDVFVLLDEVQLNDNAFQNRNIFFDINKGVNYLTIPTKKAGHLGLTIRDLVLGDMVWQKKHAKSLMANYRRTPYFDQVYAEIGFVYEKPYTRLVDVISDSMQALMTAFDIHPKVVLQSSLDYDREAKKTDLIFSIMDALQLPAPRCYLSGTGAQAYQTPVAFQEKQITLVYQEFTHPVYRQWTNNKEFIVGLSAVDMAFNLGLDAMKAYFKERRDENTRSDIHSI